MERDDPSRIERLENRVQPVAVGLRRPGRLGGPLLLEFLPRRGAGERFEFLFVFHIVLDQLVNLVQGMETRPHPVLYHFEGIFIELDLGHFPYPLFCPDLASSRPPGVAADQAFAPFMRRTIIRLSSPAVISLPPSGVKAIS